MRKLKWNGLEAGIINDKIKIYRKIAQYSPSESTKLYDKAMQRRTINPFNPKATITLLKEDLKIGDRLSEAEKRILVDRYLEVSSEGEKLRKSWY